MPTWPASLPQLPQQGNYSEKLPDVTLRSTNDQGAAKTRRRFTAGVKKFTMAFFMTPAQVEDFEDFYDNDIYSGSVSYTYIHPRTQAVATVRMSSVPQITAQGPNYMVSFEMEILP